jgi:hypothetical protein
VAAPLILWIGTRKGACICFPHQGPQELENRRAAFPRGTEVNHAHVTVLRAAMTSDALSPAGIYFGTAGGTLHGTRNAGDSWSVLADSMPPVYSVTAG